MAVDNPVPNGENSARGIAKAAAKGALGDIPGLGWLLGILDERGRQAIAQAWENWAAFTNARLDAIERDGVSVDRSDPEFIALVAHLSRSAAETADEEKRELLANAAANSGAWSDISYDRREEFVALIDDLTPAHMRVLAAMEAAEETDHKGEFLTGGAHFPWLAKTAGLDEQDARRLADELARRGLGDGGGAGSADRPHLTDFGREFLGFLRPPAGFDGSERPADWSAPSNSL